MPSIYKKVKLCENCGKEFEIWCYKEKLGKGKYCSYGCFKKKGKYSFPGGHKINLGRKHSDKTLEAKSLLMSGGNNHRWRGGVYERSDGYIMIYCPMHPLKDKDNYVFEHRLVIEREINRYLGPEERIHHIDKNRSNNDLVNLVLFSNGGTHHRLHQQLRRNGFDSNILTKHCV